MGLWSDLRNELASETIYDEVRRLRKVNGGLRSRTYVREPNKEGAMTYGRVLGTEVSGAAMGTPNEPRSSEERSGRRAFRAKSETSAVLVTATRAARWVAAINQQGSALKCVAAALALLPLLLGGCAQLVPSGTVPEDRGALVTTREVDVNVSATGDAVVRWSMSIRDPRLVELYSEALQVLNTDASARESFLVEREKELVALVGAMPSSLNVERSESVHSANARAETSTVVTATLPVAALCDSATGTWTVSLGPRDQSFLDAAWDQLLAELHYGSCYLATQEGEQVLEHDSTVEITLPEGATITNKSEVDGTTWVLDFGAGTKLTAGLECRGAVVVLTETLVQTENELTGLLDDGARDALYEQFRAYHSCLIQYVLAGTDGAPATSTLGLQAQAKAPLPFGVPKDWNCSWNLTFNLPVKGKADLGNGSSLTVTVTPSVSFNYGVAWTSRNGTLQTFWSQFSPTAQLSIGAEANILVGLSKSYSLQAATASQSLVFWAFCLPVYMVFNEELSLTGSISVGTPITVSVKPFSLTLTGALGVNYSVFEKPNWSQIFSFKPSGKIGSISVTKGSPQLRVSFGPTLKLTALTYNVAGPYVTLSPSAVLTVSASPSRTWSLRGVATGRFGIATSQWLSKVLGFSSAPSLNFGLPTASIPLGAGTW